MAKLTEIEGIGAANAAALTKAGVTTVESLLDKGADKKGREALAAASGLAEKRILRWVNMADLFRVKGIGEEYSDLLEAAGAQVPVAAVVLELPALGGRARVAPLAVGSLTVA